MKLKLALITIFLSIFGLTMLNQLSIVNAQETSSSPITSPITYFTYRISGKVTYRFLLLLKPAQNVSIGAVNIKSNEKYAAKTDLNGNYALYVNQGGYIIRAFDAKGTFFMPYATYVNAIKDIYNINFFGIPRSR